MAERYLEKEIEAPCGEIASVWDGTMFQVDLLKGRGVINLAGYFSVEALQGRMTAMAHAAEVIHDVAALLSYEPFFVEVLTKFVTDPDGLWHEGSVQACPVPEHGRNLVKPIVVENGMTAECWRCLAVQADMRKGMVTFKMAGWKDVDSFCQGKAYASGRSSRWAITLPISDFTTYPALYAELVAAIIGNEDSTMFNAALKTIEPADTGSDEPT